MGFGVFAACIWYRWTTPQTGSFRFDTTPVAFAPTSRYAGPALGRLTWLAHGGCPPTPSYDHTTSVLHASLEVRPATQPLRLASGAPGVAGGCPPCTWTKTNEFRSASARPDQA